MSYDVSLCDREGNVLPSPESFTDGGTYAISGSDECALNITYNYVEVFGVLVRNLHGEQAESTLPRLEEFVAQWPAAKPYIRDYWAPTPGNAKKAIERLISFAKAHPEGIWRVS